MDRPRDRGRDRDRDRDRGRNRSPPRSHYSRRRSRSRDRRRGGASAEEQQRLREILVSEMAKKNVEAANVLQSSNVDQEAIQRALATTNALSTTTYQQQQQQQHGDGRRPSGFTSGPRPGARQQEDRVFLELHVGGLPDQMRDESELIRFLGDAIIQRGLNIEPGNPIMSARINHVGHFAFIMLRSKEEATRAMELAGLQCFGNTLRVDRPRGYAAKTGGVPGGGGAGHGGGYQQMDETQMIQAAFAVVPNINIPGMNREELRRKLEESIAKYGESTSVVSLENLNNATVEEVEGEVRKYGNVTGVRQSPDKPGMFIVKMNSIQEAEKLVQIKRTFNTVAVKASFRPLAEWTALIS